MTVDQVLFLGPDGDPRIGPANEVEQLGLAAGSRASVAGRVSQGWTDIQRLHALEERELHKKEHITPGRYHVKGGRGVGKAHVHVYEDGSGVYVNSRGEHVKLTSAQARKKYESGFQHRLGEAIPESLIKLGYHPDNAERVTGAKVPESPRPLDKAPEWVRLSGKVKVGSDRSKSTGTLLIPSGQRSRAEFEVRDALEHQARFVPSTVYKSKVIIAVPPPSSSKKHESGALGEAFENKLVYLHPSVTKTRDAEMDRSKVPKIVERSHETQSMGNKTGWWTGADEGHSLVDQVIAHESGHVLAHDLAAQLPWLKQYTSDGWAIPGDPELWQAIEDGVKDQWFGPDAPDKPGYTRDLPPVRKRMKLPISQLHTTESPSPEGHGASVTSFNSGQLEAWLEVNRDRVEKAVSKYGAKRLGELLAELWSEYTMKANPRPPAKAYGDWVMKNMPGRTEVPNARQGTWS